MAKRKSIGDADKQEQLKQAISRCDALYAEAKQAKDIRAALAAQRDLNRLLGLYDKAAKEQAVVASAAQSEIDAAREQLSPLALHDGDAQLTELCRLAVGRIVELEQALHQARQDGP